MEQFTRTRLLIGKENFTRLQQNRVTIVGIGAVGGYVVEALARAGIGAMRLVDADIVAVSNINRQILALHNTVGYPKVEIAKERIQNISPKCKVETMQIFCRDDTVSNILTPKPDLLIDAIDSLNPKCTLLTTAKEQKIPVISSMGAALRCDPSLVKNGDLFTSSGCPLARHVRRRLRRRGIERGIPCVYSTENVDFDFTAAESEEFNDMGRNRNILGSLPTIPAIFGLHLANMAILHFIRNQRKSQTRAG